MNILITGAAGFLGSHLCDAFLKRGDHVIGVDNFLTGRRENIVHLTGGTPTGDTVHSTESAHHPQFTFIKADATVSPDTYLPPDYSPDLILHFASPASPPRYQATPIQTYLVNSYGTHLLLEYLHKKNPSGRFFFASTSEVYGDPLEHPQKESYWGNVNPNGVRSCYDESKRLGETICGVFHREHNMDVRIVRIFNTYGPRIDLEDGRVIPNFLKSALAHQPLTVFGDGTQTRSYCYIDDLIEGIVHFATLPDLAGETINLGSAQERSILETVEVLRGLLPDQKLDIGFRPLPGDDPSRRRPDLTKAKKVLSWEPRTSFQEGLQKTLEWFQSRVQTGALH